MLGWPIIMVPGIEADDAIGTLARAATAAGWKTVISTGDKDLAQLVNEHVTLINTMSNETLDIAGVLAKFGVPPHQHHRLPGADRRHRRQRARRQQGRPEDGRQVAAGARLARRHHREGATRSRARSARTCARRSSGCRWGASWSPWSPTTTWRRTSRTGRRSTRWRCSRSTTSACSSSTSATASAAGARRSRSSWASTPAPRQVGRAARNRGLFDGEVDAPRRCRCRSWRASTTPSSPSSSSTRWIARLQAARAVGARHRDRLARRDARPHRRHLVRGRAGQGRLRAAAPRLRRRARPAAVRRGASRACGPGSRTRTRPRWASTSSTTTTCSPTSASRCGAGSTTRCCRATCWRRTASTACPAWPTATSAARASTTKTCAARAPSRSRSRRSTSSAPR